MITVLFLQILFYVSAAKRSSVLSAKPVSCLDKSLRYNLILILFLSYIGIGTYNNLTFDFFPPKLDTKPLLLQK